MSTTEQQLERAKLPKNSIMTNSQDCMMNYQMNMGADNDSMFRSTEDASKTKASNVGMPDLREKQLRKRGRQQSEI